MSESKTSKRRLEATERQRQALELRKSGASFESIARTLGYKGRSSAYRAVMAALRKTLQEPADELRKLELNRIDVALLGIWKLVRVGHLQAIDRFVKLAERRAKLVGLDAPTKWAPTDPTGEKEYIGLTDEERMVKILAILEMARKRDEIKSDHG